MSKRMAKKVERFYLQAMILTFTLLIILTVSFDKIDWKVGISLFTVMMFLLLKAVKGWMELFCSDAE